MDGLTYDVVGLRFNTQKEAHLLVQSLIRECPFNGVSPDANTVLRYLLENSEDIERTRGRPYQLRIQHQRGVPMHVEVHGIFPPFRFGWNDMVKRKGKSHKQRVTLAAREAIRDQRPPRDFVANPECALCGIAFEEGDDTHWDHKELAFKTIWKAFLEIEGLSPSDILLDDKDFLHSGLKTRWYDFHDEYGEFQLTHARCNLTKREEA